MAQYPHNYVSALLKQEQGLAENLPDIFPSGIMQTDREKYNINLMVTILFAVIMKTISELVPAVDDAAWLDKLAHAVDDDPDNPWPGWVVMRIHPGQLAQYGATEADSVSALQAKIDAWKIDHPDINN